MRDVSYEEIFEDMIRMIPFIEDRIVRWYPSDEYEITAELNDGSAYRYDGVVQTFRRASTIDGLVERPKNENEWRMAFARKLYRKMLINGMNQDELAWEAGVSPGMLSNAVNGYSSPSIYKVHKIVDALGCTLDDVAYFGDNRRR